METKADNRIVRRVQSNSERTQLDNLIKTFGPFMMLQQNQKQAFKCIILYFSTFWLSHRDALW